MKASGRGGPADDREQREVVELVPKPELDRAQRQIERLQKENERRKRESERLKRESERLKQESDRLRQEVERLRKELEAALRAGKRQAAPHSRGELKANPTPPGRKAGRAYGRRACRPIPPRLDERIDVALPKRCPRCGGGVEVEHTAPQYQEEIVRRTVVRRFDIAVGRCRRCGRRVQGRHPAADVRCGGRGQRATGAGGVDPGDRRSRTNGQRAQSPRSSHQRYLRVPAGPRCPATPMRRARAVNKYLRCCRAVSRSEEHTSELQSHHDLVCRLLLEKKK